MSQIYSNWVGGEAAEDAYLITFRIPRESPLFVRAVQNEIHILTAHRTTNSNEFIFKIVQIRGGTRLNSVSFLGADTNPLRIRRKLFWTGFEMHAPSAAPLCPFLKILYIFK